MSDHDPAVPTRRMLPIPLTGGTWASLEARFPLSAADWDRMLALLDVMKPGLVAPVSVATGAAPGDAQGPESGPRPDRAKPRHVSLETCQRSAENVTGVCAPSAAEECDLAKRDAL